MSEITEAFEKFLRETKQDLSSSLDPFDLFKAGWAAMSEIKEALEELIHLHHCEMEGIAEGKPTQKDWEDAISKGEKAINKDVSSQIEEEKPKEDTDNRLASPTGFKAKMIGDEIHFRCDVSKEAKSYLVQYRVFGDKEYEADVFTTPKGIIHIVRHLCDYDIKIASVTAAGKSYFSEIITV